MLLKGATGRRFGNSATKVSVKFQNGITVKPVYNDHLYNKIYPLWFIQ